MNANNNKTETSSGQLVYKGRELPANTAVEITLMRYDAEGFYEKTYSDVDECLKELDPGKVNWINVDGIHQPEIISKIGNAMGVHHLTLEDILNPTQRPKFEDYDDYLVAILRMISYDRIFSSEQLCVLLFKNTVVSFQEADGSDAFPQLRHRLRQGKGKLRRKGADYLAYSLIDAVVDSYFSILEKLGDRIETLEGALLKKPRPSHMRQFYTIKREMIYIRKVVWPLRELLNSMERNENPLITQSTDVYIRDLYDHTIRVIDTSETYRDLLSGMMEIYLTNVNNRMNEVMKVLTIISTIFIPVTFIAGVYGMNFKFMPELYNPYGYWITWAIMGAIMIGMIIFFKVKKWF